MSKPVRHLAVAVHVMCSVGWMGAGASNVVLACIATNTDAVLRAACYRLIARLDAFLVIPLAFGALATGLAVALCSPWGVTRYWWVLVKLVLTVVVIVFSTRALGVWVQESIDSTLAGTAASPVALLLPLGAGANLVAFAFMTWISAAKPWGRTPWNAASRHRRRGRTVTR